MERFLLFLSLIILSGVVTAQRNPSSSICRKPGYFRHPRDCARFYRCVDSSTFGVLRFSIFHFSCPAGTVFDEQIQVCNHPWASEPCFPEDSLPSGSTQRPVQPGGIAGKPVVPEGHPENAPDGGGTGISVVSPGDSGTTVPDFGTGGDGNEPFGGITFPRPPFGTDDGGGDRFPAGDEYEYYYEEEEGNYDDIIGETGSFTGFGEEANNGNGNNDDDGDQGTGIPPIGGGSGIRPPPGLGENGGSGIDNGSTESIFGVFLPSTSRPSTSTSTTSSTSSSSGGQYQVLPDSLFSCPKPGFFAYEKNCHEFYVCQEVLPGQLLADQVYRCPSRYLFDEATNRCQREHKVNCDKFDLSSSTKSHEKHTILVVLEQFLDEFFSTPLEYEETKRRFGYI